MKPEHYPAEPAHLWEHFYQITQIPRPSRHEEAVRSYVIGQAEQLGYRWQTDTTGNLVVSVPASPGREDRATVIIQNHLDMVTVKTGDKAHSPTERLRIDTVPPFWHYLSALLAEL